MGSWEASDLSGIATADISFYEGPPICEGLSSCGFDVLLQTSIAGEEVFSVEVTDIAGNIAAIRCLPLSEETKGNILGRNASRILGLPA